MDTRLGAGVGDSGWKHAEWAQYARTGSPAVAETDDVMANSKRQMRSDANQRNDREASLARTQPTLLKRAKISMHLEATVVGYEVGQRGMMRRKDENDEKDLVR